MSVGLAAVRGPAERAIGHQDPLDEDIHVAVTVPLADPSFLLDIAGHKLFGITWRHWYYDPSNPVAEEPPEGHYLRAMWDLWDQINVTADPAEQDELFRQILDIWIEELPMVGIVGEFPRPSIVKKGL